MREPRETVKTFLIIDEPAIRFNVSEITLCVVGDMIVGFNEEPIEPGMCAVFLKEGSECLLDARSVGDEFIIDSNGTAFDAKLCRRVVVYNSQFPAEFAESVFNGEYMSGDKVFVEIEIPYVTFLETSSFIYRGGRFAVNSIDYSYRRESGEKNAKKVLVLEFNVSLLNTPFHEKYGYKYTVVTEKEVITEKEITSFSVTK